MKKIFFALVVIAFPFVIFTQTYASSIAPIVYGETTSSVTLSGVARSYVLYTPKTYTGNSAVPLVMFFHGGLGDAVLASKMYNWEQKAEKEGFIVAFLNGASKYPSGKFATWNAGNCCSYSRDNNIDDVGFVKATINVLESKYKIDTNKIFATGFSNGGMFSYRLACDMTDTFKAVGAVSGTTNYDRCNPSKPISIIHIHALDDDHVLYNGGAGDASMGGGGVTSFTSVPATISKWLTRNNILVTSKTTEVISKGTGASCDLYYSSSNGIQIKLCTTNTGGHSWPGGNTSSLSKATPSTAFDATEMIWEFFKSQSAVISSPVIPKITACTKESKLCSDGSYVSRTGPNCSFAICPISPTTNNSAGNFTENDLVKGWYYGDINQKKIGTPSTWILKNSGTTGAMWSAPVVTSTNNLNNNVVNTNPVPVIENNKQDNNVNILNTENNQWSNSTKRKVVSVIVILFAVIIGIKYFVFK